MERNTAFALQIQRIESAMQRQQDHAKASLKEMQTQTEMRELKAALLEAAHAMHGEDCTAALFGAQEAMGHAELSSRLRALLPGVLTAQQVATLLAAEDVGRDGVVVIVGLMDLPGVMDVLPNQLKGLKTLRLRLPHGRASPPCGS